jgi:hypothetical protein
VSADDELVTQRQLDNFKAYVAAQREGDQRAMAVKEVADRLALELARDHQQYRDEKANELREQINTERGHYAARGELEAAVAKLEAELKPVLVFMASQQGRSQGISATTALIMALITLLLAATGTGLLLLAR